MVKISLIKMKTKLFLKKFFQMVNIILAKTCYPFFNASQKFYDDLYDYIFKEVLLSSISTVNK
jgi:hypothetical protein